MVLLTLGGNWGEDELTEAQRLKEGTKPMSRFQSEELEEHDEIGKG